SEGATGRGGRGASDRPGDRGGRRRGGSRAGDPGRWHRLERGSTARAGRAGTPRSVAVPTSRRDLHVAAGSDAVRLGVDGAAGGTGPVIRTRRGVRVIPDGAHDRKPVKERGDQGQWFRSR